MAAKKMMCPKCGKEMGMVVDTGERVCQYCVNQGNVERKAEATRNASKKVKR